MYLSENSFIHSFIHLFCHFFRTTPQTFPSLFATTSSTLLLEVERSYGTYVVDSVLQFCQLGRCRTQSQHGTRRHYHTDIADDIQPRNSHAGKLQYAIIIGVKYTRACLEEYTKRILHILNEVCLIFS